MKLYLYAKSGHNFGLENIRRISAIANILKECDPIVCSADYRAATFAKQYLNVSKGVGIDVIGNLPNVMERGDMLIYDDSGEASDTMQEHIKQFCKYSYKLGVDIPFDIVDEKYTSNNNNIKYKKAVLFADDDYTNWFYDLVQNGTKHNIPLILGHYFFFGNEEKLKQFFSELLEEDEYEQVVKSTKYLLTSSVHTCLESLTCGNNPVYFKRKDKNVENLDLLDKYNIPIINIDDLKSFDQIMEYFESIISDYPQLNDIEKVDITNIKDEINKTLKLFEHIMPSLEYK